MKQTVPKQAGAEAPFPQPMATKLTGWSARASQYPIFGKTWFAYRLRSFRAPLLMLALVLLALALLIPAPMMGPDPLRFYFTFVALWTVVAVALVLGRGLAVFVHGRAWSPRREAAGIACALLFGMLVALALTPYVRTGAQPAREPAASAQEIQEARTNRLVNLVIWIPVLAWMGGPFDLGAYFRQRRLLREAQLQAQAERYRDQRNEVEAQLAVLASQVEPHFLFNTLAGVRAAMLSDPARGVVMIDHLIDYLRATIPQLRADRASKFVTLGSQLDAARAYLGVIQARMPRLAVDIDCAPDLRGAAMPPLMLISLVENAVKHGIEPKKGPASIRVAAARIDTGGARVLELTVSDDGVGFGASAGSGIGLSNIRERLHHLYGDEAALSLRTGAAGGVVASLVLPLRAIDEGAP